MSNPTAFDSALLAQTNPDVSPVTRTDNAFDTDAGRSADPPFSYQSTFIGGQKHAQNQETAGVVEARPGIIESTNIDPLNESSNKDDGWANATSTKSNAKNSTSGFTKTAAGAAKIALGYVTGNGELKEAGRQEYHRNKD